LRDGSWSAFGEGGRALEKADEARKLDTFGNPGQGCRPASSGLTPSFESRHLPQSSGAYGGSGESAGALLPTAQDTLLRLHHLFAVFAILLSAFGCSRGSSGGAAPATISREAFIGAYVELRVAALQTLGEELTLEDRDRILGEMDLREEHLLDFVEAKGRDVQFMRSVWEEVDSLLTSRRNLPEATGQRGTP